MHILRFLVPGFSDQITDQFSSFQYILYAKFFSIPKFETFDLVPFTRGEKVWWELKYLYTQQSRLQPKRKDNFLIMQNSVYSQNQKYLEFENLHHAI